MAKKIIPPNERKKRLAQKLKPLHQKRYERLIEQTGALPPEDRRLVLDFDRKITAQGLSAGRKGIYIYTLIELRKLFKKPFKEVAEADIVRVMAHLSRAKTKRGEPYKEGTLHNYRVTLKRFYKWLFGKDKEYPPCVSWIKTTPRTKKRLPYKDLLTDEEFGKLVGVCDNPRDRAIFFVQDEGGFRPGELEKMRVGHVRFDQYGAIVTVSGKTGDRAVRLVVSAPALVIWLSHHPQRENPEAPLWVNIGYKWKGTALTYSGFSGIVRRARRLAKIKKRVYLYSLRHTAATRLSRLLTESEMDVYLGWVMGSRMPSIYVHLASRDVDKSMLRIHGLVTEEYDKGLKKTVLKCPRCKTVNPADAKFCFRCSMSLTAEAVADIIHTDDLMNRLLEDPQVQTFLKHKIEEMQNR